MSALVDSLKPVTIPDRTAEEWAALVEQWRREARERVRQWRETPHAHKPDYEARQKEKKK